MTNESTKKQKLNDNTYNTLGYTSAGLAALGTAVAVTASTAVGVGVGFGLVAVSLVTLYVIENN